MHATTIRSPGAIVLGLLFAAVTGYVLLEDVFHGAPITTAHIMTAAALIGTITAGHMAWPHMRSGHWLAAIGLGIVFMAGTTFTVISAGSRNAEVQNTKAERVRQHNADRADIMEQIKTARQRLTEAQDRLAAECKTGKGPKCEGHRATVSERSDRVAVLEARLDIKGPAQVENAGYAHAGKVIASLPFVKADAKAIADALTLIMPFLLVLIVEFGTLVFWGVALGVKMLPMANDNRPKEPDVVPVPDVPEIEPTDDDRVVRFSEAFEAKHHRKPSQAEIRSAFPEIARATVWRIVHRNQIAA